MNTLGTENALLNSSSAKGESLEDMIKVLSSYSDLIILRHPQNDAATRAASVSKVPIVNAGCGNKEHPTQTLIDLFTVSQRLGRLDNLCVGFVGDIKNSRTVHSMVKALEKFSDNRFVYFPAVGLEEPELPGEHQSSDSLRSLISELNVIYVTREQKERGSFSEGYIVITKDMVNQMKPEAVILHPLPRNEELPGLIDSDPRAAYFDQAANAVPVRRAIIQCLLVDFVTPSLG